ncbi:twin-arginine translocase TatA/TatE family subunit [Pseudolysobacter antarcticus]|uniref:Sec-independent protein translocase protein TatA n=1 Tax=Pseudolysobacter antarcticus TaxID=2511995 RepID=A0A411HEP3_9GAMM|nr:twin-arginine translocase TatA/TatE family subunit [Pseudolysobacter antarcticus]QBB68952.1 twin-arginine translocase TatA/TatE family subunit [Pseudolysobacter antarcticus]
MGGFSGWHWIIVALVVVLVFGTKKLGNIGGDVASAIKSFRKGLQDDDSHPPSQLKADPEPVAKPATSDVKRDNVP